MSNTVTNSVFFEAGEKNNCEEKFNKNVEEHRYGLEQKTHKFTKGQSINNHCLIL